MQIADFAATLAETESRYEEAISALVAEHEKMVTELDEALAENLVQAEIDRNREQAELARRFATSQQREVQHSDLTEKLGLMLGELPPKTVDTSPTGKALKGDVDTELEALLVPGVEITAPDMWRTINELYDEEHFSRSTVRGGLMRLEEAGKIVVEDPGGRGPSKPRRWRLAEPEGADDSDEPAQTA